MSKYIVSSLLLLSLFGCGDSANDKAVDPITIQEVEVPTPERPEPVDVILQEMEAGFCSIDGIIEGTNLGFTGAGYANTDNAVGTKITWQINATTAGDYDVEITYATPNDRPATLTSNGVATSVPFASSGGFESWLIDTSMVTLVAGDNDIVLNSTVIEGAPNIDSIKVSGVGITASACIYVAPVVPTADTQIFVIGDSTAANYGVSKYPQAGWGQTLQYFFDDSSLEVMNRARGGRSSRNFYSEIGLWDEVIQEIDTGDYLFIQFGHNDRDNSPDKDRYTSPEDFEGYLANFVTEARAKGAIPVLVSPMVMNAYRDGVLRNVFTEGGSDYAGSTAKVANDLDVAYVDLNQKSYDLVKSLGIEQASHYLYLILDAGEYPNYSDGSNDGTHFQESGAVEMSRLIVEGLEELNTRTEMTTLLDGVKRRNEFIVEAKGANDSIITASNAYPEGTPLTVKTIAGSTDTFNAWYSVGQNVSDVNIYQTTMPNSNYTLVAAFNGAVPLTNTNLVTLHIIGDSTVADYTAGYYPQTGWGQVFQPFFDDSKVIINNEAFGGRSSKSFYENHWDDVKAKISAGDFVFIQFGINDRNNTDPARYAPTGGVFEGFMTDFANETIALGAIPVFVSTVRRNQWQGGEPYDAWHEHPVVTRDLAATLGIALIDLDGKNKTLLETVGEDYANRFYYMGFGANEYPNYLTGKSDTVHFQEAGAVEMARLVQEGITELSTNQALAPLQNALKPVYPLTVSSPTPTDGMFTTGYSYPAGTPITLKALAHDGSVFTQWLDNNSAQITDETIYQYTVEDSAAEFSAVFNNSEGLGIETTNLVAELDGADVKLSWDLRNYTEAITSLALYRYEVVAATSTTQADTGTPLLTDAAQSGTFVDNTAQAGKTYTYSFKITQGDKVTDTVEPETEVRIPFIEEIPVTNVIAVVDGTAIDLSWDIKYFNPDISYLEVHRNDRNEILGRTRIAGGAPLKGSLRDEDLEPGKTYWYMFKMVQDGVIYNTNPEAETLIPVDAVANPKN